MLWDCLRDDLLGVSFRRQHAIGRYIPDFVCIKHRLIIELDGSQHLDQQEYDRPDQRKGLPHPRAPLLPRMDEP